MTDATRKQRDREYRRAERARRKENGQCQDCPAPAEGGRTRCRRCHGRMLWASVRYRAEHPFRDW